MKGDPLRVKLLVAIFVLTLLGSLLFTYYAIAVYAQLNISYSSVYPSSPYISILYIFGGLLLITALLLTFIRFKMRRTMTGMFVIVSFLILLEFFSFLLPAILALAAAILVVYYYFKFAGRMSRNAINALIFLTIGSFLSLALGLYTALALVAIVAVYDYIAVVKTKHMIRLTQGLGEYVFFSGIVLMAKKIKNYLILGGGDMVFPALLINSAALYVSPLAGLLLFAGAVAGLLLILFKGKKGKAYPAMSIIGPIQIGLFLLYSLVSYVV